MNLIEGFLAVLHKLVDILLHILENKVQFIVLLDDFKETNYVGVPELYQ